MTIVVDPVFPSAFVIACTLGIFLALYIIGLLNPNGPRFRDDTDAFVPIPRAFIIVAVAATFALVLGVFTMALLADSGSNDAPRLGGSPPELRWQKNEHAGTLSVFSADRVVYWSDLDVNGCTPPKDDLLRAGDELHDCHGNVQIYWRPTNTLLYQTTYR